jgi:hypothetical protein
MRVKYVSEEVYKNILVMQDAKMNCGYVCIRMYDAEGYYELRIACTDLLRALA